MVNMQKRYFKSSGMTLIELLATLAVLTALAGVALAGLGDLAGRTRQTETVESGSLIQADVVGRDGTYSAFLSDLGRVPVVLSNTEGKGLGELFNSTVVPAGLLYDSTLAYTNTTWPDMAIEPVDFPSLLNMQVKLPCGWRGPYYVSANDEVYDGWGNDWQVNIGTIAVPDWQDSTAVATLNKPYYGVRSLGRNGTVDAAPTDWEDEDRSFEFATNLTTAELTVEIYMKDAGAYVAADSAVMNRLRVALYAPYASESAVVVKRVLASNDNGVTAEEILPVAVAGFPHPESTTWDAYNIVRFSGLTPGVRRLFVFGYQNTAGVSSNGKTSGEMLLDIKPGGNVLKVYLSQDLN